MARRISLVSAAVATGRRQGPDHVFGAGSETDVADRPLRLVRGAHTGRLLRLLSVLFAVAAVWFLGALPAGAQSCAGDCDDSGEVTVNEIITGVRIALGELELDDCRAADADGNAVVAIGDLITAINVALSGCSAQIAYEQAFAETYAPVLFFDSKQGQTDKCFPSDAGEYYAARKAGSTARICNTSYSSIEKGEVPVYFQYARCEPNVEYVAYWFFYGWQDYCSVLPPKGEHPADWEHIVVKVVNEKLDRVLFFQHAGQYARIPGNYMVIPPSNPMVYVGKNSHGSYHDDGGTGTCCYFEDYRNPSKPPKFMVTALNLVRLSLDESSPEWMRYDGVIYWDGLVGPLHRTQDNDLCNLPGCRGVNLPSCSTSGCFKSDIFDKF